MIGIDSYLNGDKYTSIFLDSIQASINGSLPLRKPTVVVEVAGKQLAHMINARLYV